MIWVFDDGGRIAQGFRGKAGDCVTRAIAIATGLPYQKVYDDLNLLAKTEHRGRRKRGVSSSRNGVYRCTYEKYLKSLGWEWTPTMRIGSGCKVHLLSQELPRNRIIVALSRHLSVTENGYIYDTHDPSRGGSRCVYGYYQRKEKL